MSGIKKNELYLNLMLNREKNKVLFAEANSDFVDVLLSLLTLPLGRVLKYFEYDKVPVRIGSLNHLRESLDRLDGVHFWTEGGREMLKNPRSSFQDELHKLKLHIGADDFKCTKYFTCGSDCNWDRKNISMYYKNSRCPCGEYKNHEIRIEDKCTKDHGVFTVNTRSFLITDDLRVFPNVPGTIENLVNLGIVEEIVGAELTTVTAGVDKILDLLKGSLLYSPIHLTDLFLHKMKIEPTMKSEIPEPLVLQPRSKIKPTNRKIIMIKAMIQKSTNKFLFAEAGEDFIDFLFSFLTIPLGALEHLFGGNAFPGSSIDNLYRSIYMDATIDFERYFKSPDIMHNLLKLPRKYLSKHQIFSALEEKTTPEIYYNQKDAHSYSISEGSWHEWTFREWLTYDRKGSPVCFTDPKGQQGSYLKPATFMVTDDLSVTPLCLTSSLDFLDDDLEIPLSDVKEVDIEIGLEEGLSILRASLSSTSVLSEALVNSILEKQEPRSWFQRSNITSCFQLMIKSIM